MYLEQMNLIGTAFLGVFATTNDKYTLLPQNTEPEFIAKVEEVLGTEPIKVSIASSSLVGVLSVMNSNAIAVPKTSYTDERKVLEEFFEVVVVAVLVVPLLITVKITVPCDNVPPVSAII